MDTMKMSRTQRMLPWRLTLHIPTTFLCLVLLCNFTFAGVINRIKPAKSRLSSNNLKHMGNELDTSLQKVRLQSSNSKSDFPKRLQETDRSPERATHPPKNLNPDGQSDNVQQHEEGAGDQQVRAPDSRDVADLKPNDSQVPKPEPPNQMPSDLHFESVYNKQKLSLLNRLKAIPMPDRPKGPEGDIPQTGKPILKLNDLRPPDHLDAVRMEQDGHLNKDYKKEIFLGNHEAFEEGDRKDSISKLKDIFTKVDADGDKLISPVELEEWIIRKVKEHFEEAAQENEQVFQALDTDHDGYITWKEFLVQYLIAKGNDKTAAEKYSVDYDTIDLSNTDKDEVIRFKFRWAEADSEPQDNKLTVEEFRAFRHPESSNHMMTRMVQDILENLDKNRDEILTEDEFAALPPGEVESQYKATDRVWQEERRKEFRNVMDLDKDGKVTKKELKNYVDPRNPNHSRMEARNLVQLADLDKDGMLTVDEVLESKDLFLGSKMVNTGRSFHDEF